MAGGPRSFRQLCLQTADASIRVSRELCSYCTFSRRVLRAAAAAVVRPRRIRWKSVAAYMDSCGSDAMPIIALLGLLIGVILAFQAIVQLDRFGGRDFVANLLGPVIVTELAPLVTAVVLAGRTGSSFAAELGSMKADEELDALFNRADFAVGSLARHRSGIYNIKTLKNREYAARGFGFVYSETDDDFDRMPYTLKVPADESPVSIPALIEFYQSMTVTPPEIRDSIRHLSWREKMKKVYEHIVRMKK